MIIIDQHSRTPVYEQIKEQIMNLINTEILKPDDKLPSIRQLSGELGLNVNTVKRAFSELETEKVTYSVPGKGIFISENAIANKIVKGNAATELRRVLASSKAKGLTFSEATEILNEIYEKGDKYND